MSTDSLLRAASLPESVQLVDEDDAGGLFPSAFEEVANPRGADADEHLDEFRAADREERHAGLAGHGAGQQRLSRSGRTDQEDALGHPGA